MGRFSNDNSVEFAAFGRQDGQCAYCGKKLARENYETGDWGAWGAHHIDGNLNNNSVGNCACLCVNNPENCHLNVGHCGDYKGPKIASRSSFAFLER